MLDETARRRGLRHAIYSQCAGMPGSLIFTNGIMLSYLLVLGFSNAAVLSLLTLPRLTICLLLLPAAFLADRIGLHRLGMIGLAGTGAAFVLLTAAGLAPPAWARTGTITAILIFAVSLAAFEAGWFPLLNLMVPAEERGRYFGRLRVSWQSVAVVLTFAATALLQRDASMATFRWILVVITLLLFLRVLFFSRLPPLRDRGRGPGTFRQTLLRLLRQPGYLSFGSYLFLLTLFTGACPWIFNLLQKETLAFSTGQIVLMGNLLFIGALLGYFIGGRSVDVRGQRSVFVVCHFAFGLILFLFPLRSFFPLGLTATMGILTLAFGAVQAASSIAISSEILALIPSEDRALAAAVATVLLTAGQAASGLLSAAILRLQLLSESWIFLGRAMSAYDTMILGCGAMLVLLSVTIGLIPAVIGGEHWYPRGS